MVYVFKRRRRRPTNALIGLDEWNNKGRESLTLDYGTPVKSVKCLHGEVWGIESKGQPLGEGLQLYEGQRVLAASH